VASSSGSEDEDPHKEAKAYNWSIYLMVSMPYVLLLGVGTKVYLSKRNLQGPKGPETQP
jgi:hypothetical protein